MISARRKDVIHGYHQGFSKPEVCACTPSGFDEISGFAAELKKGNPVLVNSSNLTQEEKIWAVQFLNGVIYAIGGNSSSISAVVFLFVPGGMEIMRQ